MYNEWPLNLASFTSCISTNQGSCISLKKSCPYHLPSPGSTMSQTRDSWHRERGEGEGHGCLPAGPQTDLSLKCYLVALLWEGERRPELFTWLSISLFHYLSTWFLWVVLITSLFGWDNVFFSVLSFTPNRCKKYHSPSITKKKKKKKLQITVNKCLHQVIIMLPYEW